MANYATLKAAIADVVKTNGEQEITGANLQSVLLSIVNSIGAEYTFAGVATPSTSAGTPDQNVFYIGGVGEYANFGSSITVPTGSIGVFKYNGTWSNQSIHIYSINDDLIEDGGVLSDTMKSILASATDVPYVIKGALVNAYQGVYSFQKNNSWDLVLFTVKRDADWAVISGTGTGSNQGGHLFDPSVGINTAGRLAGTGGVTKKYMSTLYSTISSVKQGGYNKDILVTINIPVANSVDYGSLFVMQGKFDGRYFCVPSLLTVGNTGSPQLSKIDSYVITPYIKIDHEPIAAINFWSNTNTSATAGVGIHFYDETYAYVGTVVTSDYTTTGQSNTRAIVIEKEDIPQTAEYIRFTAQKTNKDILALAGGVEKYDSLGVTDFSTQHFFDKSSEERISVLPFTKNVDNILLSDYYLLTGGQIIISNVYINETANPTISDNIARVAFYDEDKEYVSALDYSDKFNTTIDGYYTVAISPSDIPAGAKYLTFFTNKSSTAVPVIISGLTDLNDPAYNYLKIQELDYEAKKQYVKNVLEPFETATGYFMRIDGLRSNSGCAVRKFNVDEGEKYYYSAYFSSPSSSFSPLFFMDDDENIIGYLGTEAGPITITDALVTIPAGATQVWQNTFISSGNKFSFSQITDTLKVDALSEDVEVLQQVVSELGGTANKLMKVVINNLEGGAGVSSFYVRAKYNSDKDIIITHYINGNGLLSFNATYVGDNTLQDAELMTGDYLVSTHSDSTAPIRAYTQYWHLFAQHGYPVPYFSNSVEMTSADVGALWKDQLNRKYTIGKVSSAYIWLLPVIYQDGNGHYTRDWHSTATSPTIETLTYVSGGSTGAYTTQIEVSALYQEQLRSIMQHAGRIWTVDGRKVTETGTYYCDDFSVSETQYGYDPATISSWFGGTEGTPDLTGAEVMAEFTASYNYKGAQCAVNTTINLHREAKGTYSGTQQQFFFDNGDYKAMFMIPKAAARDGVELDKPFNSPSSAGSNIEFLRNATQLKNVDNPVDRQIGFLYDENTGNYLVGMAAGLSLISGDTVTAKRNINRPVNSKLLSFSPSNTNKFYVYATDSSVYDGGYFPAGYFKEINYYVSYFDPAENVGQVYWYKDGSSYVIYAHCQSAEQNLAINVPAIMEGLSVEVIEKTDDAELLTGTIQNGKFFVNYNSDDANYIVLKTK